MYEFCIARGILQFHSVTTPVIMEDKKVNLKKVHCDDNSAALYCCGGVHISGVGWRAGREEFLAT